MARSVSSDAKAKASAMAERSGPAGLVSRLLRRWALPLFVGWTLFVWGGRLRNLAADPGGFAEASRWSLWGSAVFVSLAVIVLAAWLFLARPVARMALAGLVVFTTGVWLVRAVDIALGDHSIGFIVVHVVLAVVSIGLGVLAWRNSSIG